jgi:hypothetical protein
MVPDLGFQHLLPASFITQERDVKEARGVAGGVMLPPNRYDEVRVI